MYYTKITIPKMSDTYKLYIYRSKSADDINTISKIRTLSPIAIIDESTASFKMISGRKCYEIYDKPTDDIEIGVEYLGPPQNALPTIDYETNISIIPLNKYTYVNQVTLNPLPIDYKGTMFYYSVIGVDETNNLITHLSKVSGVLVKCPYTTGTRHLYSCDDYQDKETDEWKYVGAISFDEDIIIGNLLDKMSYDKLGCPVIEKVNIFKGENVNVSLRPVASNNFMVLEIPNVWQKNNKTYNYRKLKSYKVQFTVNEQYSDFSFPSYQSLLPVSIEKMIILEREDTEFVPTFDDERTITREIIRKDGVNYKRNVHRKLGFNKYNIPLEEKTAVFSESSVQDLIKMQIEALPGHTYSFAIYLVDVYGNMSEPATFIVRT